MKSMQLCTRSAALLALTCMLAVAQAADPSPRARDSVGADFGSGWNILSIPAAAFQKRYNGMVVDLEANGYVYVPSGAGGLWAPIQLPSGTGIGYLGLYAFDNHASNDVTASIGRYTGYGSKECIFFPCPAPVPPTAQMILQVATSGAPGYRYEESAGLFPLHTVNNDTAYGGGGQYVVVVDLPAAPALELLFKGVDVWWKRQISPAPSTATFTDVPLGSPFFAEIEAMRSSGITAGCTLDTYCPDANVTRRQMAAFFARALGLHWGY